MWWRLVPPPLMKFGYEWSIEAMKRRTKQERGAEDGGETCEERQT